jgi:hypothetical protein
MAAAPQVDYTALAKQFGGTPAEQPATQAPPQGVDYTALAKQYGGVPAKPEGFASSVWDQVNPLHIANGIYHSVIANPFGLENDSTPEQDRASVIQGHASFQKALDAFKSGDYGGAAKHAADIILDRLPGPGTAIQKIESQAQSGDTGGAIGTGLGLLGSAYLLKKTPEAAEAVSGAVGRAAQAANDFRQGIVSDPHGTLVQALKPRATAVNFDQSVQRALPDMKDAEAFLGKPIEGVDDAMRAVKLAKASNRDQLDQFRGPASAIGQQVDLTPVANAMEASIPDKFRFENTNADGTPNAALKAKLDAAAKYRGAQVPVDQAERLLQDTNAELDSYYAKYPAAQRKTLRANPETAQTVAQGDQLRSAIYNALDDPAQGAGPRELQLRYGALMDMEDALMRRKNVAARQQPESLQQQLSKVAAVGKTALGAGKILTGNPLGGATDVLEATAMRRASDWLKEQQTTDALISRAFRSYKGGPNPSVAAPYAPRIAGLLEPAPLVTEPPADTSYVRGVTPAEPFRVGFPASAPRQIAAPIPGHPPINIEPRGTAVGANQLPEHSIGPAGPVPVTSAERPIATPRPGRSATANRAERRGLSRPPENPYR